MKILYIDNSPWWGGAEEGLKGYLHAQEAAGWETLICVPFPEKHHVQYEIDSTRFVYRNKNIKKWMAESYVNPIRGLDRFSKMARARQLNKILRIQKPDVVYFNLLRNRDIWDIRVAKKSGCKIVLHIRNLIHQGSYSKELLDHADLVVCVSNIVCEQARNTGTNTKVINARYGVRAKPEEYYDRNAIRNEFNIPTSSIVGIFPAIIDPRKGQDLAIEAFTLFKSKFPEALLVIAGRCPEQFSNYGKKIDDMANTCSESIRVIGHQKDMNKLYLLADYVLALSHDGEAFGRIPVEAAQYHLPIIATRAGATPELVIDKETGFLVEPGVVPEVVQAFTSMHDTQLRVNMGKAAYTRVRTHFDLDTSHRVLRSAIENLFKPL